MNYGQQPGNDYLSQYRTELEKQSIEQAQNFLRRYGLFPPPGTTPATNAPPATPNSDLVTIPVSTLDQAENAPVDAFRTFIYPNFNAGEIYVKKIDDSGKSNLQIFIPKGTEMGKHYEDSSKKIMESLSGIEGRLKTLENQKQRSTDE